MTKSIAVTALLCPLFLVGCSSAADMAASSKVCNDFMADLKAHKFNQAYARLAPVCKSSVPQPKMEEMWAAIEKANGKPSQWTKQGFQAKTGTWGKTINYGYSVTCPKRAIKASFSCVPGLTSWQIQGFSFNW
ncbi:hypothetical protein EON80_21525 [bacterium]|nr:MAG: hypothetical protein EON80_21525 [bacterium]